MNIEDDPDTIKPGFVLPTACGKASKLVSMLSAVNRADNANQLATFFAWVCIASANRSQEFPSSIQSTD